MFSTYPRPFRTGQVCRSRCLVLLLPLALVMMLAILTGCGGGQDGAAVIARVGDKEISSTYYESRLAKLEEHELPQGPDRKPLDMAYLDGKLAFLEILINKEVMYLTAQQMGYTKDPQFVNAYNTILSYEAGSLMRKETVNIPASQLSDEEVAKYYEHYGTVRYCRYVITNFLDDAEAARRKALDGADWDDIVREYHDGGQPPEGKFEITVPFLRYAALFENGVYDTEIGGVTEPLRTDYGYWVLRVDNEKTASKPPVEDVLDRILEIAWNRKKALVMEEFKEGIRVDNKVFIDDEALWKVYQGLPENEQIFYPGTQDAVHQNDLVDLEIATVDLDLPFYGYEYDGEETVFTIGDYKAEFDRMSVFKRPKQHEMLGGLRQKLLNEMNLSLLDYEAKKRGYTERDEVVALVDAQMEEMLVNRLYIETVKAEERVTPEELAAFWAEHGTEYVMPEVRGGMIVYCKDEAAAADARAMAVAGGPWQTILDAHGVDPANKEKLGVLEGVHKRLTTPVRDALFALELSAVSEPFAVDEGRWAVARLDTIAPERPRTKVEVSQEIGARIKKIREEELFQSLLDQWTANFQIEIFEDELANLKSWKEVTDVAAVTEVQQN